MARTNFARPTRSTKERGYGHDHQTTRRQYLAALKRDGTGTCTRCGGITTPDMDLHLDHADNDRTQYLGLAHATCNRRAGARLGHTRQATRTTHLTW